MGVYPELQTLGLEELVQRFLSPPPEEEVYADSYYVEVAEHLRTYEGKGIEFLRQQLSQPDINRARAALFALSARAKSPETVPLLLRCLHDPRPLIVAEAIDGLRHNGWQMAMDQIIPLVAHASPAVVSAALRYISAFDRARAMPLLYQALQHPEALVRENACDELDQLEALEAISALLPLLEDPHPQVRQAAQTALDNLRGVQDEREKDGPS